jgi:hypothetical protein
LPKFTNRLLENRLKRPLPLSSLCPEAVPEPVSSEVVDLETGRRLLLRLLDSVQPISLTWVD